jgi:hypothetical protein
MSLYAKCSLDSRSGACKESIAVGLPCSIFQEESDLVLVYISWTTRSDGRLYSSEAAGLELASMA